MRRPSAGRAPTSGTTGTACSAGAGARHPARADGRHVVLPVAAGDGGQPRRLRGASRRSRSAMAAAGPRPAGSTSPRRRPLRGRDDRRRLPLPGARGGGRCGRAVDAARHGMEHRVHYADVRPAEAYADSGCSSSASRTPASSSPPGCFRGRASWSSCRRRRRSCRSRRGPLVGVRARYVQPYEDHVLGGGVSVLDASIDRIERASGRPPDRPPPAHRWRRATSRSRSMT